MIRKLRLALPPLWVILILLMFYGALEIIPHLMWVYYRAYDIEMDPHLFRRSLGYQLMLTLAAAFGYGIWKVHAFHPGYRDEYRRWLELTPWEYPKPLPMGSVFPTWVDLSVLILLWLMGPFRFGLQPNFLLLVFAMGYTVPASAAYMHFAFVRKKFLRCRGLKGGLISLHLWSISLLFVPLARQWEAVRPIFGLLNISVSIYACGFVILWVGVRNVRRTLMCFPWPNVPPISRRQALATDHPVSPLMQFRLRKSVMFQSFLCWPHSFLAPNQLFLSPEVGDERRRFRLVAIFGGWWILVLISGTPPPIAAVTILLAAITSWVGAWFILAGCEAMGCRRPARIAGQTNHKEFFARYDMLWIAPLCGIATTILLPLLFSLFHLPLAWSVSVSFFTCFFIVSVLSPSREEMFFSGDANILPPTQQAPFDILDLFKPLLSGQR